MLTLQNVVIGLTLLLFAWYFAGQYVSRQRAQVLLREIRQALAGVGQSQSIRWFGRSAFQVDVAGLSLPLTSLKLFCLVEARDFPLAWLWNRLRGRRDQIVIHASFLTPPPGPVRTLPAYGIRGLTGLEQSGTDPHLRLTLQVGAGDEGAIRQAVELVRQSHVRRRA